MGQPISSNGRSGIGVVDKVVTILDAVAGRPRSLAELVAATELPRATAHRLAVALEAHRLIGRDPDGRFILGPHIGQLGAALPDPLVAAASPVLAWVRDECEESAQLYRIEGEERVCVAVAERSHGLRTTVPVGSRLPLSAGSGGQVLTAWAPAALAEQILLHAAYTARTLVEVRKRGWAQSIGQREAGVASVSAPVRLRSGEVVAAVSISGPIERLGRSPGQRFAPIVTAGARRITTALSE